MECLMCATIQDPNRLVRLDCSHSHCRACLYRNLSISLASTPFRPVRCCSGPIKAAVLRVLVAGEHSRRAELQRYRQRLAEHQARDKLYCHDPKCHAFIPMALRTRRSGKCARCLAKTCRSCEQKWHFGPCQSVQQRPAVEDTPSPEVLFLSLAKRLDWKRCPQCRNFVQKYGGCNHITCRCGCEFCYRCGRAPYSAHGPCAM
ncbi:hypothetical protein CONLIGDRAFT_56742 [Coniochaeta ligniaria NRRL 30616]|uniref:RBR-type E3 ubiquitin transferase n=1 Tax=Coniochaeta ligniaria NRRL 30616 TaxID=1408157 RepID=A0A1J7J5I1_9PEZI|nr:hypothetical protein CONLIGDRAFT_56742 [Coniochaeta ligniaria NRRL 30616]